MKIVVSPAKSLDYESKLPTTRGTQPAFLETTAKLNRKMARMTKNEISKLMGISDKLADLNYTRYQEFEEEHNKKNSRPAMYAFNGDVYTGLDAYTIPTDKLDRLQDTLRILSGLYGLLKPLDLMQPYRLEMGTSVGIERKNNLYEVWQSKVTKLLNDEMEEGELFINLASNEYFKAVDTKKLKAEVISPVFKDFKNGKLKIISFFAKKARGAMVRFIIDKDVKTLEELKGFDYMDYRFSEEHTEKENEPVFIR
ncbi:peroxide stress protein YaaA [Salegentibacter sp. BDJ18]|uniref:peroxide stress protein YaaA n=1 Tax=Salegentibacter sp. BDJ18 TaxID=2816376 RepID=UPI001AAFC2AB|nr:peroxide stress protein YaaA [Salegentibacter sp. BDJ18]MBO2545860.1 peroxide stress protein YaaA [Salegentibacter sp. BDJ18]